MYNLYILKDPLTKEIRYVGYSKRVKKRLWEHIRDAKSGVKTHKSNWIKSILVRGELPIIEVVESTNNIEQIKICEIKLISELRGIGVNLTNLTIGGDGNSSKMKKDHPMRNWNKGRKMSESSKKKLSESRIGIVFSEEHKKKLSKSKIGKKIAQDVIDRRNKTNSESVKVVDIKGVEYFFDKIIDAVKLTGVNSKQIKKLSYNMKASRRGFRFFL